MNGIAHTNEGRGAHCAQACRQASWWALCGLAQDYWVPVLAGALLAVFERCFGG